MSKRRAFGCALPAKIGGGVRAAEWGARTLTSKSSTGRSTVDVNPGLSKGSSMESADSTRTNPFPLGDILQRCAPSDLSSSDNWQLGLERLNNENMDSN